MAAAHECFVDRGKGGAAVTSFENIKSKVLNPFQKIIPCYLMVPKSRYLKSINWRTGTSVIQILATLVKSSQFSTDFDI